MDARRLSKLQQLERLSETLSERPAGDLFAADLEEARAVARHDPRFQELVEGLESRSLGDRLEAVTRFFEAFPPAELANLELPPHLNQLRLIYLSSRSDIAAGSG